MDGRVQGRIWGGKRAKGREADARIANETKWVLLPGLTPLVLASGTAGIYVAATLCLDRLLHFHSPAKSFQKVPLSRGQPFTIDVKW